VSNIAIERLVINRRPVLHVSYSLGSTGTVGNQYLVVAHGKAFDVTVTAAAADAPVARQIAQTFVVR
jgi:1-deoxy-D-xylulose 5-phosphate reductoisomerase